MRLISLAIENYKSYFRSDRIAFSSDSTVVTGRNNTGKSALLEAMSLAFTSNPHRSLRTKPNAAAMVSPSSRVIAEFEVKAPELRRMVGRNLAPFQVVLPQDCGPWINRMSRSPALAAQTDRDALEALRDKLFYSDAAYKFEVQATHQGPGAKMVVESTQFPLVGNYERIQGLNARGTVPTWALWEMTALHGEVSIADSGPLFAANPHEEFWGGPLG